MFSMLLMALVAGSSGDSVDRGVSEALARERSASLAAVRYDVTFTIPADRQQPVQGRLLIRATLDGPRRIVIDFSAPKDRIHSVRAGGEAIDPIYSEDHLIIPAGATRAGENAIAIEFTAGDE